MPGLVASIEETAGSTVFVVMAARLVNSVGSPVLSAIANDDGRAIADEYRLEFSAVFIGVSATVTGHAGAPDNPYAGASHAVLLDGATVYPNIIGGVDLVFQ
jgi:hypothetical protein